MTPKSPVPAASFGVADLESVYDALAAAIDQVGAEKSERFLVKLALLCARDLGDARHFHTLLDSAVRDL